MRSGGTPFRATWAARVSSLSTKSLRAACALMYSPSVIQSGAFHFSHSQPASPM